jgi:hypothetical protein
MKPLFSALFPVVALLFIATEAIAQNGAYSSYYSYTVNYNLDGTSTVTPVAEVTGIDDVSDWIEGQYRPVCTVRPKIQLTGDADWVGGTRVALGRAVDQVRNGQAIQVPSNGSNFRLQYSVEVDATCSGPPNPNYYEYPDFGHLNSWANIDINFWYLSGFAYLQTSPPYHLQYCPDALSCPLGDGVASILNFVDFADFLDDTTTPFRGAPYRDVYSQAMYCQPPATGWDRKIFGQVFNQFVVAFTANGVPMTETVSIGARNDLGLSNPQIGTTTTSLDQYANPPRTGAYDDRFYFCTKHSPCSGETDAIQTLTWNGLKVLHSNLLAYKCGGITVDGH